MIEIKQNTSAVVPVALTDSSGNPVTGVAFGSVTASVAKSDGTEATLTVATGDWRELTAGAAAGQGVYLLTLPASSTNLTGSLLYFVKSGTSSVYRGAIKVVAAEEADTKAVADALRTDYTTARAARLDNLDAAMTTRAPAATALSTADYTTARAAKLDSLDAAVSTRATQVDVAAIKATVDTNLDGKVSVIDTKATSINTTVTTINGKVDTALTGITHLRRLGEGRWKIHTTGEFANQLCIYGNDGVTIVQRWQLTDENGNPSVTRIFERNPLISVP